MQATGVLYQSLWNAISEIAWPSHTVKEHAVAFIESLMRKRHMENTDPMEFTDLAYNYFVKKYGGKYRLITKPLINAGILQSSNYYRPGYYTEDDDYIKGQCLSYRINPALLDDEIIKINYKGEKSKQRCRDAVTMKSKQLMRQIRIPDLNSRELIQFVKRSLSEERIRALLMVNDEIRDSHVHIKGRLHPIAIEKVLRRTKDIIKDGKYCHIEHLEIYIKRKRRHLMQAYCDQLLRIKHRNIYADRNETNLRLDSNLTNLKSDFMSLLAIDGQRLSQVDLKNSQFRFFVYLLEQCERDIKYAGGISEAAIAEFYSVADRKMEIRKERKRIRGKPVTLLSTLICENVVSKQGLMLSFSKDYMLFKKLVKTGQLYEHIRELIWKETGRSISRNEAKKAMFTIAFASHRYHPEEKRIMRKYFPSIVGIIDGFKKGAERLDVRRSTIDRAHSDVDTLCPPKSDIQPEADRLPEGENSSTPQPPQGGQADSDVETPSIPLGRGKKSTPQPPQGGQKGTGSAAFAVLLQQTESLIFIDEILAKCHKKGLKALSKHDSIVCRQCDKHKVTKVVCKVLNSLFGRYTYALDIDGDLFDLKPKRKSRLGRVALDLFNSVMGYSHQANAPPETIDVRRLTGEGAYSDGETLCPSDISLKRENRIPPGMKRGDVYEMRKAFYNAKKPLCPPKADIQPEADRLPKRENSERSRGMTLEEMRAELLRKK